MRNYFKYLLIPVVIAGYSPAHAGSYEDFFRAIVQDDATIRSLLNRGFDPNSPNPDRIDGLYLALRDGNLKAAGALIEWPKTKVESRTPQDESPLMMASLKGQLEVAKKLIDAYIDAESPNGTTPLMMAAHYGTPAAVKLLLESGADATLKNQLGLNAVDFANRGNRKDAAELITAALRDKQPKGKW